MPGEKQVKNYTGNIPVMAITLLAIGLLLWAALDAYQRYQYHQQWQADQLAEKPVVATSPQRQSPTNTRPVAQRYLFGKQKAAAEPVEVVTKAPATRLNLKLIGVIAAKEDGVSKAIIQIDNADIGVFSVGDKLPKGNATIERFEATQVLLKRNGKLESLAIIRPELTEEDLPQNLR